MKQQATMIFVGGVAIIFVIVVSLVKNGEKEKIRSGVEDLKARSNPIFQVVPSQADGKCLYHSLLTGLRQLNLANKSLTVNDFMVQIKKAYLAAIKNRENDALIKALETDFTKEINKIDTLLSGKSLVLSKTGFPDVGTLQVLIHQGYFPFRVNLGVVNQQKRLEVTRFLHSVSAPPTIYIRQIGGDDFGGGHFDALILKKKTYT